MLRKHRSQWDRPAVVRPIGDRRELSNSRPEVASTSGQFESASEEFREIYSVTESELRGGTSAFEPSGRTRQRAAWRTVSLAVSLPSYVTLSLSVSVYVCAWLCYSVARSVTVCSQPSASWSRRRGPVRAARWSSSLPLLLQGAAAFDDVHNEWVITKSVHDTPWAADVSAKSSSSVTNIETVNGLFVRG